jgi:hypothetical protein
MQSLVGEWSAPKPQSARRTVEVKGLGTDDTGRSCNESFRAAFDSAGRSALELPRLLPKCHYAAAMFAKSTRCRLHTRFSIPRQGVAYICNSVGRIPLAHRGEKKEKALHPSATGLVQRLILVVACCEDAADCMLRMHPSAAGLIND